MLCSGLSSALQTLARRSAVPVVLDVDVDERLPESVEVAAYYIVSEALTNAAKHAQASKVHAAVHVEEAKLRLSIRDNGIGGANPSNGSGLVAVGRPRRGARWADADCQPHCRRDIAARRPPSVEAFVASIRSVRLGEPSVSSGRGWPGAGSASSATSPR